MTAAIHPNTRLGQVALRVQNLDRSLTFYQDVLGFQLHDLDGHEARLGVGGEDLILLEQDTTASAVVEGRGMYHFAILLPSRTALARSLWWLTQTRTPLDGFADHFVSESLYLSDPDGNGVELYADRPRQRWQYEDGALQLGTVTLDIANLLTELNDTLPIWRGLPSRTQLGHIHLFSPDKSMTEAFYQEVLGLEMVARLGWAMSFLGAGGYHHHVALRYSAAQADPNALGLQWYSLLLPNEDERQAVIQRLHGAGFSTQPHPQGVFVRDPGGNGLVLGLEPTLPSTASDDLSRGMASLS
jgi:catechol 2,3-dioxygenase